MAKNNTHLAKRNNKDGTTETLLQISSDYIIDPDALEKYKQIDPDICNRIMQMSEKEQASRHEDVKEWRKTQARGQWLGFAICVISVLIGGVVAYMIKSPYPVILSFAPAIGMIWKR